MRILEACIKSQNLQGGTIRQAIDFCLKNGRMGSSAYVLGLRTGLDQLTGTDNLIELIDIPYNTFGGPEQQVPDYVLGIYNSGRF